MLYEWRKICPVLQTCEGIFDLDQHFLTIFVFDQGILGPVGGGWRKPCGTGERIPSSQTWTPQINNRRTRGGKRIDRLQCLEKSPKASSEKQGPKLSLLLETFRGVMSWKFNLGWTNKKSCEIRAPWNYETAKLSQNYKLGPRTSHTFSILNKEII